MWDAKLYGTELSMDFNYQYHAIGRHVRHISRPIFCKFVKVNVTKQRFFLFILFVFLRLAATFFEVFAGDSSFCPIMWWKQEFDASEA